MLFSCSIRENIAYGADDPETVTTEKIYTAARVANAYNFIQSFPQGFDTVVGEKGVLLSGQNVILILTPAANVSSPQSEAPCEIMKVSSFLHGRTV